MIIVDSIFEIISHHFNMHLLIYTVFENGITSYDKDGNPLLKIVVFVRYDFMWLGQKAANQFTDYTTRFNRLYSVNG